jgi:hypothetical protein
VPCLRGEDGQLSCRLSRKGRLNTVVGGWFEVVEELVLKAVEDAIEEVFALDGFSWALVEGDDHGGLVLVA